MKRDLQNFKIVIQLNIKENIMNQEKENSHERLEAVDTAQEYYNSHDAPTRSIPPYGAEKLCTSEPSGNLMTLFTMQAEEAWMKFQPCPTTS
mgnify:CR=1 FL=1